MRDLAITADERRLLDGVSFKLPAGATLAIVGPTGSGKTTLVDAVLRMQEVAPGAVRIGGGDVTRIPLAELRGLIGYAPQDAFLFSATVAENIAFGIRGEVDAAARDERVRRAAEAAGLAPDVAVLPEGYDTLVGERGITLSGGQRQRVALARALAADPRILILDDSLSSVDAETERDDPDAPAADPGGANVDPDLAPGGGGEGRRPDPGARRRPRRRARARTRRCWRRAACTRRCTASSWPRRRVA